MASFVTPNVFGLAPTHSTCRTEGNIRDLSGHVGRLFQRQAAAALTGLYSCDMILLEDMLIHVNSQSHPYACGLVVSCGAVSQ